MYSYTIIGQVVKFKYKPTSHITGRSFTNRSRGNVVMIEPSCPQRFSIGRIVVETYPPNTLFISPADNNIDRFRAFGLPSQRLSSS